jgi:hypothetical protein
VPHDPLLPIDLGDGLVLRQSRSDDVDALAAFNAEVHRGDEPEPAAWIAAWTRDLLSGRHPAHDPDDFTIVEERASGRIVSALNLISQSWSYGGVPIGVGQIELVGTHPDYRRRGLIRRQFEVVHRWSAERGQLVQGITGIPWYYRQFGYEYALEHDHVRFLVVDSIPKLAEGEAEHFRLRPATLDDAALCVEADAHGSQRYLLTCLRDEAAWRYEIGGREPSPPPPVVRVIETIDGRAVGYVVHEGARPGPRLLVIACELVGGASWLDVAPAILRGLAEVGRAMADEPLQELMLRLETEHPLYRWVSDSRARRNRGYAWYIRVPDLAAFVRRVAPVLEARLAASEAVGYTGELRFSFYRDGLRLAFEGGRLAAADQCEPVSPRQASACFPELTFLQLLMGYRSIDELTGFYPDCLRADGRIGALIDVLFPKLPSTVYALN